MWDDIGPDELATRIKAKEKPPAMASVAFRCPKDEFDRFKDACYRRGVNASAMLREFMLRVVELDQDATKKSP